MKCPKCKNPAPDDTLYFIKNGEEWPCAYIDMAWCTFGYSAAYPEPVGDWHEIHCCAECGEYITEVECKIDRRFN